MSKIRFVGVDVHADTIAVAVAEPNGEVRPFAVIADRPESVRKLLHKLSPAEHLRVCYEAGPTGYVLYWQLTALGVRCASDRSHSGTRESGRPSENRSARCYETGAQPPGR